MRTLTVLLNFGLSLTIFLISLRVMSSSMQAITGDRLSKLLGLLTVNSVAGIFTGAITTMIIQSSSAVTVMMIALVNARVINLKQAFGIILGANIGTTLTAQIVVFDLSHLALPIMICGLFLLFNHRWRVIGSGFIGFGGVLLSLEMMTTALIPIVTLPFFRTMLVNADHTLAGIITGIVTTAIIQSSSAVTSIIIILAKSGLVSLSAAIAIALGSNIGTVLTSLIASIGLSKEARATAYADLVFNLLGVLIVIPFMPLFIELMTMTSSNIARQVANAHTIFNLLSALVALPAIDIITSFTSRLAGLTGTKR